MLKRRVFTSGYINLRKHSSSDNDKMRPECLFIVQIIHILAFKILAYNYGINCLPTAAYPTLLALAATAASPFLPTASFPTVFCVAPFLGKTLYARLLGIHPFPIYYALLISQILDNIKPKDFTNIETAEDK